MRLVGYLCRVNSPSNIVQKRQGLWEDLEFLRILKSNRNVYRTHWPSRHKVEGVELNELMGWMWFQKVLESKQGRVSGGVMYGGLNLCCLEGLTTPFSITSRCTRSIVLLVF